MINHSTLLKLVLKITTSINNFVKSFYAIYPIKVNIEVPNIVILKMAFFFLIRNKDKEKNKSIHSLNLRISFSVKIIRFLI